jgi:hypothetical protein
MALLGEQQVIKNRLLAQRALKSAGVGVLALAWL